MKKQATWEGLIIAESENCIVVEDNDYFPPQDVKLDYFSDSQKHTICPWKGKANYYHLVAQGTKEENIAWYYPNPKSKAEKIEGYIAFDKRVVVEKKKL